ncbi:WbqC family protein [Pectobacterium brasiliense]|uniref:WbqC family protein n=1 Tax=Pectobacterium brasiliense TaxID=180957 RepID=UPI00196925B9|nr:WbqC family protein [Pectobacterium brasiliense]MBN3045165.1 WbqC family protein [Pectobacterium brasiliense]
MNKSIAIMQPYVFPYVGYFSLIDSVDIFVFYDDVNYIKNGWINRNRILINNGSYKFSIPISNSSQNVLIGDVNIHDYDKFKKDFKNKIFHAYKKAPFFESGYQYVDAVLDDVKSDKIADLSISSILNFYNMFSSDEKTFLRSSELKDNFFGLQKDLRLINISKHLGGGRYINAIGGIDLYSKEFFLQNGIELSFLKPGFLMYKQFDNEFVSGLSIVDIIMFNNKDAIANIIKYYEVV